MSLVTSELYRPAATVDDFFALLKPRVMSLVIFTGLAGIIVAPGPVNLPTAFCALLCIAIAAGASGALNMAYDGDIDALMTRTASRPIPLGHIARGDALAFGWTLAVAAVTMMLLFVNALAAGLLAFTIFFYVGVYTLWLKRRTPQNIVIGGGAGAFPAVIGWAAVTGHIGLLPMLLFAIVFFWTPPHFWSLALYAAKDYEKAGIPMLPVVKGAKHTRLNVLVYSLLLLPLAVSPWALGLTGRVYGLTALILNLVFVYFCWGVYADKQDAEGVSLTKDKPAKAAFKFSILYLFVLFLACAVDRLV